MSFKVLPPPPADDGPILLPEIGLELRVRLQPRHRGGQLTIIETVNAPGFGPPLHRHAEGIAATEKELAGKACRFLKAEMKRAGVTYGDLAKRLEGHGLQETEASIASKLSRGTFAATFMLAVLAALEMESLNLSSL